MQFQILNNSDNPSNLIYQNTIFPLNQVLNFLAVACVYVYNSVYVININFQKYYAYRVLWYLILVCCFHGYRNTDQQCWGDTMTSWAYMSYCWTGTHTDWFLVFHPRKWWEVRLFAYYYKCLVCLTFKNFNLITIIW